MDAYAELIAVAAGGRFRAPDGDGWTAEQIVAHVARNHEELITVTEAVLAGDEVRYDNRDSIDVRELNRYAASYGGLRGLADRVAETVTVLRDLASRLSEPRNKPVPERPSRRAPPRCAGRASRSAPPRAAPPESGSARRRPAPTAAREPDRSPATRPAPGRTRRRGRSRGRRR